MEKEITAFKDRLVDVCDKLIDFFGYDLEKERNIIKHDDNIRKILLKSKTEIEINYGINIVNLYQLINKKGSYYTSFLDFSFFNRVEDINDENIQNFNTYIGILKELVELYNDWIDLEYKPVMESISQTMNQSLGVDEETPNIEPEILVRVNEIIGKKLFKTLIYKDTGEKIKNNDVFHISKQIGFSHDLTKWFSHIQNQTEFLNSQNENKIFVSLFGKLDSVVPECSNFIIVLQKKGTIWIASDRGDFDNPYQQIARSARRSFWTGLEEKYSYVDLPYNLFSNFEELTKSTSLMKMSNVEQYDIVDWEIVSEFKRSFLDEDEKSEEFNKFDKFVVNLLAQHMIKYDSFKVNRNQDPLCSVSNVSIKRNGFTIAVIRDSKLYVYGDSSVVLKNMWDLNKEQRIFLVLLVQQLITYNSSENIELDKVMLASEFSNIKLLEGAKIVPSETTSLSYWHDAHKIVFEELRETIEENEPEKKSIALYTHDVVMKSKNYEASWLSTPEKLQSLSDWVLVNDLASEFKIKIHALKNKQNEGFRWLDEQFKNKFDEIIPRIFQANEINLIGYDLCGSEGFSVRKEESKSHYGNIINITAWNSDSKRGFGIGKDRNDQDFHGDYCKCCGSNTSKKMKKLKVTHYKTLVWLLGLNNRNELHPYLRQYRGHQNRPYKGNSLLDNTHPYNRLTDPCSDYYSNGIQIDVFICGKCFNKNVKKYGNGEDVVEIVL